MSGENNEETSDPHDSLQETLAKLKEDLNHLDPLTMREKYGSSSPNTILQAVAAALICVSMPEGSVTVNLSGRDAKRQLEHVAKLMQLGKRVNSGNTNSLDTAVVDDDDDDNEDDLPNLVETKKE
jgi:hypothetical protein